MRTQTVRHARGAGRSASRSALFVVHALLWLLCGCEGFGTGCGPDEGTAGAARTVHGPAGELVRLSVQTSVAGLSGAAFDAHGVLWVVPERERVLLALEREGDALVVRGTPRPLVGIPAGLDTEALAFVEEGKFVVGTEGAGERESDDLWLVEIGADGQARATERIEVHHLRHWGVRAEDNRGIEGLCHAAGWLVLGVEHVRTVGEQRVSPLALMRLDTRELRPFWLTLSSATGKIAGLACREGKGSELEVMAIERHYGTSRLLRFELPTGEVAEPEGPPIVEVREVVDLAALFRVHFGRSTTLPNFEGIGLAGDEVLLISDNHHGRVTGPTIALRLQLP